MRLFILVSMLFLIPSLAHSATISVPADYPAIQDAIDASVNGDTVLVWGGTYVENIDFKGKAITVVSLSGPDFTRIDGGNPINPNLGSVVRFVTGEKSDSVLSGFILTNGSGSSGYGGGIYCDNASPTLINNVIYNNTVSGSGRGAGLYATNSSSLKLMECGFENNSAGYRGGGVAGDQSDFELVNCMFYGNSAGQTGGGIYTFLGELKVMNCSFSKNAANSGCAVSLTNTKATVTNSILWGNGSQEILVNGTVNPTITYSCIKGGWQGTGNIDEDPDNGGYILLNWRSPCINRGTNHGAPVKDKFGFPRPYMGAVDMGVHEFMGSHSLGADAFTLSESTGGVIRLFLFGGAPNGGRNYVVLGSVTGTGPGTPLGPGAVLPLNWDLFTNMVIQLLNTPVFSNFSSSLSWGTSGASAIFDTQGPLPSGSAGLNLSFAFLLYYPMDFVSNPVTIEVVP